MGFVTGISWAHHTFNGVWGCTQVSPACDNCYAMRFAERLGLQIWGPKAERRLFGPKHWAEPLRWNARALEAGERRRVFAYSMGDWCEEHPATIAQLPRLWELWRATPGLDWLMLTKRHGRLARSLPPDWGSGYPNVWLGVTAETEAWWRRRVNALRAIPARVRWVSCEPQLGEIAFHRQMLAGIAWVVFGGESKTGQAPARPYRLEWPRQAISVCQRLGVRPYLKQLGTMPIAGGRQLRLRAAKGDDPREWPAELQVQEFPEGAR